MALGGFPCSPFWGISLIEVGARGLLLWRCLHLRVLCIASHVRSCLGGCESHGLTRVSLTRASHGPTPGGQGHQRENREIPPSGDPWAPWVPLGSPSGPWAPKGLFGGTQGTPWALGAPSPRRPLGLHGRTLARNGPLGPWAPSPWRPLGLH